MADERGGVTVFGTGTVRVPTSQARVRLQVERREAQPGAAMREAGALVRAALEVLRDGAVPDAEVRTEALSVTPNRVWVDAAEQIQGYDARQSLVVEVTDLDRLDQLLGRLVERCGAGLQIEDVSLSGEPTPEARSQARRAAVQDAHEKAADYARFTGCSLADADAVIEMTGAQRPVSPRGRMAAHVESMPIAQGEDTTTVTVQVHWRFQAPGADHGTG